MCIRDRLYTVEFKIKGGAAIGNTELKITDLVPSNFDGDLITVNSKNSYVKVLCKHADTSHIVLFQIHHNGFDAILKLHQLIRLGIEQAVNTNHAIAPVSYTHLSNGKNRRLGQDFPVALHGAGRIQDVYKRQEYDYQYMHIDSLCESFDLLVKKHGQQSGNHLLG